MPKDLQLKAKAAGAVCCPPSPELLHKTEKDGFNRFFAKRQQSFEPTGLLLGPFVYIATLRLVWLSGNLTPLNCCLFVFAAATSLLPLAVQRRAHETYLKWRDPIWALHFLNQHILTPQIMVAMGVSYREPILRAVSNPVAFVFGFIAARSVLWQVISPLFYPMRLRWYLGVQAALVLLAMPFELDTCAWAAAELPAQTGAAFLPLARWGRAAARLALPLALVHGPEVDVTLLAACRLSFGFIFAFLAFVAGGFVLWWLERKVWETYLSPQTPLEAVAWPGGPPPAELNGALQELWCKDAAALRPEPAVEAAHAVAHLALAAAVLWHALELVL